MLKNKLPQPSMSNRSLFVHIKIVSWWILFNLKNTIRLFLTLFKIYPTIPTRDSQCRHITHTDTEPGREHDELQWVRRHWSLETDWSDSLLSPPHRSATVEPPRRRGRESSFLNVLFANSMRNVSPGRLTGTWLGILNSLWVQPRCQSN